MNDSIIYCLNLAFICAIFVWAIASFTEMQIYKNTRETFKQISELFTTQEKVGLKTGTDYLLIEGIYKNRRVVCRLSRYAPSALLHYTISLYFFIEPLNSMSKNNTSAGVLTRNTQLLDNNKILYHYTTTTSIHSLFFTTKIHKQEIIEIFEELTQAAEMVEAQALSNEGMS
jgi:hypothetical protein